MNRKRKQLRRTMLYVPGNNPGMIKDAQIYPADCVMFDLEDAVSPGEKDAARFLVYEALRILNLADKECFVRINALDSPWGLEDIEAVVRTGKVGIRLPKTENAQDVTDCEREIARVEESFGLPLGSTSMIAAVESAAGVLSTREIACASKRLVAIAFGAEDYVTDLKTTRSPGGVELLFGRSMVLLAARVAGIDAIDTVYSDVSNEEGFKEEVKLIKQLGFDGKSVINPRQIEPVHKIFAPTIQEAELAAAILETAAKAERKGSGVAVLDGKMIDKPIAMRAEHVVELARASGLLGREEL